MLSENGISGMKILAVHQESFLPSLLTQLICTVPKDHSSGISLTERKHLVEGLKPYSR